MYTSEIFDPSTRKKKVIESFLNSQFGVKLAATEDGVKIHSLINKLQEENMSLATDVAGYEHDARFVKNSFIIEALRTMLSEIAPARTRKRVNEAVGDDLDQAELILVAKSTVEKLQGMAEDVAEMQTDELMSLEEKIKETFSPDQGQAFSEAVDTALSGLLEAIKSAKEAVSQATAVLSGEQAAVAPEMDNFGDTDLDDAFAAADAASGPSEEPSARELK